MRGYLPGVGVLLLVAVSGSAAWVGDELADAIAEADRLDPCWQYKDLLPKRAAARPPDPQNGAILAKRAIRLIPAGWKPGPGDAERLSIGPDEIPSGYRLSRALELLDPMDPIPPNLFTGLRSDLKALAPAVAEARKLVQFPKGQTRFQPDTNPLNTRLTYAQDLRYVARLLQADATLRAADGAIRSIQATINAARSLGDEPTAISQLVRMAIDGVAVASLQRVLAHGAAQDAALAAIQAELMREADVQRLVFAARRERASFLDLCEKLQSGVLQPGDLTDVPAAGAHLQRTPPAEGLALYWHNTQLSCTYASTSKPQSMVASVSFNGGWSTLR